MNIFDKFKKKPKSEELLKEELIAEMRAELSALSSYDRDDIFAVQERSESLDRLEDEMKLLNALKAEDLKKIDAKSETKKGIIPSVIGAIATIGSAIVLIVYEKDECITGSAAREFLRKIFNGFGKKN